MFKIFRRLVTRSESNQLDKPLNKNNSLPNALNEKFFIFLENLHPKICLKLSLSMYVTQGRGSRENFLQAREMLEGAREIGKEVSCIRFSPPFGTLATRANFSPVSNTFL